MEESKSYNVAVDIGDDLTGLLEKLASQIGVTAETIFPWYVKQSVIEGWVGLSVFLVFIVVSIISMVVGSRSVKNSKNPHESWYLLPLCCGGLVLLVALIIGASVSSEVVGNIINPEYTAMQQIVRDLSRLK